MVRAQLLLLGVVAVGGLTAHSDQARAQQTGPPANRHDPGTADDAVQLEDVVVTARRGSSGIAPQAELDPADIDRFNAYDIGEVIRATGRAYGLGEGEPVLIINGRRVADPRRFLGFPPDALARVEVLPPEAGARYGADASRRVLNLVLQPSFRSRDVRLSGDRPTGGGRSSVAFDGRQSSIVETNTTQFGLRGSRATALRAAERPQYDVKHADAGGATLAPATDSLEANASFGGMLGNGRPRSARTPRSAGPAPYPEAVRLW